MSKIVQITCEDLSFCPSGTIFTAKSGLECVLLSDKPERKEIEFEQISHGNKLEFQRSYFSVVMIDLEVYKSAILCSIKKMFPLPKELKPQLWNTLNGVSSLTLLDTDSPFDTGRMYTVLNYNITPFLEEGSTIDLWEV
jgi:hypothetical protein